MTDYWKSQAKKFCDFCKCWITDNKPSIEFHERGKKHKENVASRIKEVHKRGVQTVKDNEELKRNLQAIENAALEAYKKDIGEEAFNRATQKISTAARPVYQQKTYQAETTTTSSDGETSSAGCTIVYNDGQPVARCSHHWSIAQSPEGYYYYYNSETLGSQWEVPICLQTPDNDTTDETPQEYHELHTQPSTSQVKINYPSKPLHKHITDETDARIVRGIACKEHEAVVNAVWSSPEMKNKILLKLENDIRKESTEMCRRKNPSVLSKTKPESIISLKDSVVVKELEERAPTLHRILKTVASGKSRISEKKNDDKVTRAMSIATSVLFRCRSPYMSATSYRLSILLWHGGAEKQKQEKDKGEKQQEMEKNKDQEDQDMKTRVKWSSPYGAWTTVQTIEQPSPNICKTTNEFRRKSEDSRENKEIEDPETTAKKTEDKFQERQTPTISRQQADIQVVAFKKRKLNSEKKRNVRQTQLS